MPNNKIFHYEYSRNFAELEVETEQRSPVKNEKGKKKRGRPSKSQKRKNMVRILLKETNFFTTFYFATPNFSHCMYHYDYSIRNITSIFTSFCFSVTYARVL